MRCSEGQARLAESRRSRYTRNRHCPGARVSAWRTTGKTMSFAQILVLVAAAITWYGFASRMRRSFRYADVWTPAKTLLVVSGWTCTVGQLLALAVFPQSSWWHTGIALGIYALANGLFWSALRAHGRDKPAFVFTEAAPHSFCTNGPYQYVRHPLYAAYILAWLSPPVATGQWWLLATTGWMALLYGLAAWREERAFDQSPFAAEYQAYRSRTGMFLPRPFTLWRQTQKLWRTCQR